MCSLSKVGAMKLRLGEVKKCEERLLLDSGDSFKKPGLLRDTFKQGNDKMSLERKKFLKSKRYLSSGMPRGLLRFWPNLGHLGHHNDDSNITTNRIK